MNKKLLAQITQVVNVTAGIQIHIYSFHILPVFHFIILSPLGVRGKKKKDCSYKFLTIKLLSGCTLAFLIVIMMSMIIIANIYVVLCIYVFVCVCARHYAKCVSHTHSH